MSMGKVPVRLVEQVVKMAGNKIMTIMNRADIHMALPKLLRRPAPHPFIQPTSSSNKILWRHVRRFPAEACP